MRVLLVCLLACLHIVHSQTYPFLRHNELTFQSNSFIDRGIVSVADKLECVTNHSPCCVGTDGGWTDPARVAIQEGSGGTIPFYVTRTAAGTIDLNRLAVSNGQEQLSGMYECEIPGSGGTPEMMFIYLGNQSTGQLTSAVVSFTELLSEVNEEPEFVLTCRSEGGPATTVQWTRDSTPISEPSTVLRLVDRQQNTVYESRLTVTGRDLVDYSCTVSSNRNTYFGEAGSSFSSEAFTVSAAGEPTRLNAADLLSSGRIIVTWTPPSGSVTGYTLFLEPGGVEVTVSSSSNNHAFEGLPSGTQYMVSLVALSDQLPSMVVGPVAPTNLQPPSVTLSATTTNPTVGGSLQLACTVVLPEGIELSGNPQVEFYGPGDGMDEGRFPATSIFPSSGSYLALYTFENLGLFSHGVYKCSATYTIEGSTSPAGEAALNVDVTFGAGDLGLEIAGVPYVSNTVTLTCAVFLSNSDITIQFMWSRVGGELPPSASVGSVETDLFTTKNALTFSSLAQLDSGEYVCQVTISISPGAGNVPAATLDESYEFGVLIPEVTVATEPETQRVLDHEDYNTFTITCSASAIAGTNPLALGFVRWDRRVDPGEFQSVSTDSYSLLTGSPADGYVSWINGTESTASTTAQFRCTAALTESSSFSATSTASVTVQGPAAPMSVSLRSTDVTDTTATISWTVASIAYTPETYTVLYGTTRDNLDRTSGQQRTSGSDISVTSLPLSLPVSGLDPDSAYYYTVNASNSYSFTLYDTNTFNTSSRRPNPPTNLAVTPPSGALTYDFTWTASTAAPGAPPIVSYTLTCDPTLDGVDDVNPTPDSVTSGSVTLPPGLSYTCCVVATSDGVTPSNRTCLENLLTTPPSVPTGAPMNFIAVAGRRNLALSWSPPEPRLRNGDISSYTVSCSSPSSSTPDNTTGDTKVVATGLTPNTMYSCSVLATNSAGSGPLATVDASTLEDAPDAPPQHFRHSVVNGSQRVEFSWAPPPSSSANGAITGYAISCNPPFYESTTELSLNVTTLTPGTSYSCNITASTAVGAGPPTTPLLPVLTVPGTPEDVSLSVEEEGLLVMWGQVEGIITGYKLTVNKTSRGDTVVLTSTGRSLLVRSDEVGGFEMVSIEVSGVNSAGYGPPSDTVSGTTPSIPPGPVVELNVMVENGTLTVEWNPPPYPNGILSRYEVSVETYQGGVVKLGPEPVDVSTFRHALNVSSLEDGTPYNAVVVAVNDKGNGEKNPTIFFSNELASGPVALTPENQRRSANGDILLSWEKPSPDEARGVVTSFEISFSESGAGDGGRRKRQECPRDQCQLGAGQTSGCCRVGPDQTNVTISGLDPSKSYDVSVSVVNGVGVGEAQTFTIKGNPPNEDDGGFPVAIVVVVVVLVVAVVLLVVVIVVILVLIRRRLVNPRRKSKTGGYSAHPNAMSPGLDDDKRAEEMVSLSAVNATSPEEAAGTKAIRLDQFEGHVRQMHEDRDKGFEQEYLTFSTEPTAVHDAAKDPRNKNKNRFANIFPYDFNRVPLQLVDNAEGSDYINASFVHGYSRSNAYIAAQGPMSGTILDFWRMIWEHRPASIVMLTKLVEGGKRKCELYWPEKVGDTFKAGCGIHVQYKEVVPFADFEIKKFIVTNDQKPKVPALEVQHFQFLSWPDHGVPKFATALISFIRRLRQYHNPQSAMLVHCSAGVGRTGAFILLDSMLERIASESSVNVYECLTRMRQQRIHLVQTLVQYVFIHDALVELVTCGDTSVPASGLRGRIKKMVQNIPEGDVSGFTAQFRLLARVSRKPSDSDNSEGLAPHNKDKNRYPGRIPYDMNRVRLKPTGVSGAEYINASFLDGYKQKNAYMAAQTPVAATVNDFWRMVWEFKSRAVVMLCQLEENGQEMSHQYWPTQLKAKQLYGKNSVTLISEEHPFGAKEIVVRKFEITDEKNTAVFTVTQYHVLCWPEEGKMVAGLLLQLISDLNKLQRNTENKPITVLCNDGMGRTGAFICIHAMLDRVNSEHIVDFFQFVKSSRINRPDIVREEEHYIMCHEAVAEYLDSFQTYANFT